MPKDAQRAGLETAGTTGARVRIGVDLGGTKIEAIALSAVGAELARQRIQAPRGSYDDTVAAVAGLVRGLEAGVGGPASVGIGIPGAPSRKTGLIKNANSTWLIGHPFQRDIEAALGRPVKLENDANCFAVSEAVDGAGAGRAVVFGVILGTGVGGGIAVEGRCLSGANAIAGEWGHNPLPAPADDERPGPRCYCGRFGCIESFLSGPALERQYAAIAGTAAKGSEIAERAAAGEAAAGEALARYEQRLARALAVVINILDPDAIVLGGGVSNITRLYESVPRLWLPHVFSDAVDTALLPPVHGDSSGVRGAAWLWGGPLAAAEGGAGPT